MPERIFNDERYSIDHTYHDRPNASSWLVPLLLLPVAFLGGWVANGYLSDGQIIRDLPGIETGVGGGPERNNGIISPVPTTIEENEISPSPTPTEEATPTPQPTDMP